MERIVIYDVPEEGRKCLSRDVWVLVYLERIGLVLDYYAHEERDSLRKKFRPRSSYTRLSHNRSRELDNENISEGRAPLPDWVKARAKELFCESLNVLKWDK